jgi:hypothetical protein
MEKLCKFSVLRYVPDENREEFINIGLVFHSPEDGFVDLQLTNNFKRLKAFDDEVDINFLKIILDGIKEDFSISTVSGPTFSEVASWDFLEKKTSIFVNQLQFSSVNLIRTSNITEDYKKLFKTYVYFDVPKKKRITENDVRSIMNKVLRTKDVFQQIDRNISFDIGPQVIELDYQYESDENKSKLIKTFSFDYSTKGSFQAPVLAKEWAWNFDKLKKRNNIHRNEIMTVVYVGKDENKNIRLALDVLREETEIYKAKNIDEIELFADILTKEVVKQK